MFRLIVLLVSVSTAMTQRRPLANEYPSLSHIPKTSFDCKKHPVGYFADPDTKCQVYHVCDMKGNKFSYLCPNGTLFHQQLLICAHWYQVNCNKAIQLYEVNKIMFPYERFKADPNDRHHKHERTAAVKETSSNLDLQTSTLGTFHSDLSTAPLQSTTRRPFPPFNQFRQFPQINRRSTLEVPAVETAVSTISDVETPDPTTTTQIQTETEEEESISTSSAPESTPWWSQFGGPKHNEVTSVPEQQQISSTQETAMNFSKLKNSNLLDDLPVNEECPLCSPHFIQDGHCSPCVVIR